MTMPDNCHICHIHDHSHGSTLLRTSPLRNSKPRSRMASGHHHHHHEGHHHRQSSHEPYYRTSDIAKVPSALARLTEKSHSLPGSRRNSVCHHDAVSAMPTGSGEDYTRRHRSSQNDVRGSRRSFEQGVILDSRSLQRGGSLYQKEPDLLMETLPRVHGSRNSTLSRPPSNLSMNRDTSQDYYLYLQNNKFKDEARKHRFNLQTVMLIGCYTLLFVVAVIVGVVVCHQNGWLGLGSTDDDENAGANHGHDINMKDNMKRGMTGNQPNIIKNNNKNIHQKDRGGSPKSLVPGSGDFPQDNNMLFEQTGTINNNGHVSISSQGNNFQNQPNDGRSINSNQFRNGNPPILNNQHSNTGNVGTNSVNSIQNLRPFGNLNSGSLTPDIHHMNSPTLQQPNSNTITFNGRSILNNSPQNNFPQHNSGKSNQNLRPIGSLNSDSGNHDILHMNSPTMKQPNSNTIPFNGQSISNNSPQNNFPQQNSVKPNQNLRPIGNLNSGSGNHGLIHMNSPTMKQPNSNPIPFHDQSISNNSPQSKFLPNNPSLSNPFINNPNLHLPTSNSNSPSLINLDFNSPNLNNPNSQNFNSTNITNRNLNSFTREDQIFPNIQVDHPSMSTQIPNTEFVSNPNRNIAHRNSHITISPSIINPNVNPQASSDRVLTNLNSHSVPTSNFNDVMIIQTSKPKINVPFMGHSNFENPHQNNNPPTFNTPVISNRANNRPNSNPQSISDSDFNSPSLNSPQQFDVLHNSRPAFTNAKINSPKDIVSNRNFAQQNHSPSNTNPDSKSNAMDHLDELTQRFSLPHLGNPSSPININSGVEMVNFPEQDDPNLKQAKLMFLAQEVTTHDQDPKTTFIDLNKFPEFRQILTNVNNRATASNHNIPSLSQAEKERQLRQDLSQRLQIDFTKRVGKSLENPDDISNKLGSTSDKLDSNKKSNVSIKSNDPIIENMPSERPDGQVSMSSMNSFFVQKGEIQSFINLTDVNLTLPPALLPKKNIIVRFKSENTKVQPEDFKFNVRLNGTAKANPVTTLSPIDLNKQTPMFEHVFVSPSRNMKNDRSPDIVRTWVQRDTSGVLSQGQIRKDGSFTFTNCRPAEVCRGKKR